MNIFRLAALDCVTLDSSGLNILYEADMFIFISKNHFNVGIYGVKIKLKCQIFSSKNIIRIFIPEQYSSLFWQVCSSGRGGVADFRSEYQQVTKILLKKKEKQLHSSRFKITSVADRGDKNIFDTSVNYWRNFILGTIFFFF